MIVVHDRDHQKFSQNPKITYTKQTLKSTYYFVFWWKTFYGVILYCLDVPSFIKVNGMSYMIFNQL